MTQHKVALDGRRTYIDRELGIDTVKRIVTDGRYAMAQVGKVGNLADGVGRGAKGAFGYKAPAARMERQREVRIDVDTAHVARVEAGFGASEVTDGRAQPPIKRRREQRLVDDIVAQGGQVQDSGFVAIGRTGKGLKASHVERRDPAVARVGERDVADDFRADGLREVIVEDEAVQVAGQVFDRAGGMGVGREILASFGDYIDSALVNQLIADGAGQGGRRLCRGVGDGAAKLLLHATVDQCIPADDQVIESAAAVTKVAIRRPAALAEEFNSENHIHAAIDGPVVLLAEDEALDRRVADDRNEQAAFAAILVNCVAQIRKVKQGNAKKLEVRVRCRSDVVVEVDGTGDDLPVRPRQIAVGHGSVDDAIAVVARLQQDARGKQERSGGGVDGGAACGMQTLRAADVIEAGGVHVEAHIAV